MLRESATGDFEEIYRIINDAAVAYKGVIPDDRWHDPYMTKSELHEQIDDGVTFSCYYEDEDIYGVMGIQDKGEVNLIRHAYVLTSKRTKGIGSKLLEELLAKSEKPVLIETWKAATWAIRFYVKHGFKVVAEPEKKILLRKYWKIPDRQVEASVVLADRHYDGEKQELLSRVRR